LTRRSASDAEVKDDGKAHVKNPKAGCVDEALAACPVEAISK
jgi:ferredoxin